MLTSDFPSAGGAVVSSAGASVLFSIGAVVTSSVVVLVVVSTLIVDVWEDVYIELIRDACCMSWLRFYEEARDKRWFVEKEGVDL